MNQSQELNLDQRLAMRLTTQQLRFVKLLELNEPELEEAVSRELEDNPALEKSDRDETPAYLLEARNGQHDDWNNYEFAPADSPETLYDSLRVQLSERDLPEPVVKAALYIVGSLDSNGYLRRPLASLVNDMAFGPGIEVTMDQASEALAAVRQCDPPGVGATDLRDCLRLQLLRMPVSERRDDALLIVETQFEAFTMKHTDKIAKRLKIGDARTADAIGLILTLNPKPGSSFASPGDHANVIVPDLVVSNEDGHFTVSLNSRVPDLAVSRTFSDAVNAMPKGDRKARKEMEFVTSRHNDARDFIKILAQRQETLLNVMSAILQIQREYFETEDVYRLKPMMIKDITALTGYDPSVVSRSTNNKYVATPWGVYPLRFFFSDSIGDDSEDGADALTNRKVEAEITAIVDGEDKAHPLSDESIREMMGQRGYEVSRRTVAKYRDRVGIPVARLRRSLK